MIIIIFLYKQICLTVGMNQKNLNISSCRSGYGMTDQGKNKSLHELQTTDWHLEELKKTGESGNEMMFYFYDNVYMYL